MNGVAEILDRATSLIEPDGAWIQGGDISLSNGRRSYCAMGALWAARRQRAQEVPLTEYDEAWQLLRHTVGGSVVQYNDAPERTQAEVVAKFREAASKARGESLSSRLKGEAS
jgi:hypothetical protein